MSDQKHTPKMKFDPAQKAITTLNGEIIADLFGLPEEIAEFGRLFASAPTQAARIAELEQENAQLRTRVAELETNLANTCEIGKILSATLTEIGEKSNDIAVVRAISLGMDKAASLTETEPKPLKKS